jgi:hypothetical protein
MNLPMSTVIDRLGSNCPKWEIRMMAKALSLHPWLNTDEESKRLQAARYAIRHWDEYQAVCSERRNRRS